MTSLFTCGIEILYEIVFKHSIVRNITYRLFIIKEPFSCIRCVVTRDFSVICSEQGKNCNKRHV